MKEEGGEKTAINLFASLHIADGCRGAGCGAEILTDEEEKRGRKRNGHFG